MASRKQHPAELRERAVAMVFELRAESGNARGSIARVGERLGINPETLRNWVEKAEIDSGQRPGTTSDDKKRITELEREVRELRRANEILKAAVMRVWKEKGRGVYGARKVWRELKREGTDVARCTVERLMGEMGIAGA